MAFITNSSAETIVENILSDNNGILSTSIIDMSGNILSAKSRESFNKAFGLSREGGKYGGTLAVTVFSLVNQVRNIAGETRAIITVNKNCKMMLLPLPSCQIMVGLVLESSINAEDDNIANKIERLVADTLWRTCQL
jgi:hypothetical protein